MAADSIPVEVVRLQIRTREEGGAVWLVARLAHPDTGEVYLELGRLNKRVAENHPPVWEAWKACMTRAMLDMVEAATGHRGLVGSERPAPDPRRN